MHTINREKIPMRAQIRQQATLFLLTVFQQMSVSAFSVSCNEDTQDPVMQQLYGH